MLAKKVWWQPALALALAAALVAGCGSKSSDTAKPAENKSAAPAPAAVAQDLLVANDQDPVGLDPAKNPAASSLRIIEKLYNGLTRMNEKMEVVPDLAEKWENPDPLTWSFTLKKGVKFHSGKELTADDVKYTYDRILDKNTASIAASYFAQVAKIEATDKYTVKFTLKEPFAPFLTNTSSTWASIVNKDFKGDLNKAEDGTGPFKLGDWVADDHVKLVKFADYFVKGQPKLESINFLTMKEEAARLAAVRSGKVQLTTISADSAQLLAKESSIQVLSYQSLGYSYLGFNLARKPFDNPKVRQAISLVVDRQEVIDTVWKSKAVLTGPTPPALTQWAVPAAQLPDYKVDVNKAKQLLAEAGLPNGFKTTLTTASTYPDMVDTAQVVQKQLKSIGIDAEIKQQEWGAYVNEWKAKGMDMMVGRNTSGTDPDRSLGFFFATDGSANVWNFSDAEFDKLVADGRKASKVEDRQKLYQDAQKRLVSLHPNLFLASYQSFYAVRDNVKGFVPYANGSEYSFADITLAGK
jgi:peptide/nickel transport system substrate-binding protein